MDAVWFEYIPWVYASIQGIVTLVVSIIGAKYVRNEFLLQKSTVKQQTELTVNMNTKFNSNDQQTIQSEFKDMEQQKVEIGSSQSETVSEEFKVCNCHDYTLN